MPLVRVNPNVNKVARVAEQANLLRDLDSFFSDLSAPFYNRVVRAEHVDFPIDLYETEDEVILEMATPGLKPEDLEIGVEGKQLTIRGKIVEENVEEDKERHYWMKNIARTEFSRSLTLPDNVDFENGFDQQGHRDFGVLAQFRRGCFYDVQHGFSALCRFEGPKSLRQSLKGHLGNSG